MKHTVAIGFILALMAFVAFQSGAFASTLHTQSFTYDNESCTPTPTPTDEVTPTEFPTLTVTPELTLTETPSASPSVTETMTPTPIVIHDTDTKETRVEIHDTQTVSVPQQAPQTGRAN